MYLTGKFKKNRQKGITLIEVMVALLFLSIGLIPLLSAIVTSISLATRIKNNLIASNLAQEGVEVARSLRDKAWMDKASFTRDIPDGNYLISWNSSALISYDPNTYVKISPTSIYSQSIGADTIFKRKLTIAKIVSACNCEVQVTSQVTWTEKTKSRSITVEDHLFDWK